METAKTMINLIPLIREIEQGTIPALSILQPWPHRIFHEGKDIENRDWPTRRRGWFVVHAGKSNREIDIDDPECPRGGVVGMARIVDCVSQSDSRWFMGKFGFVLADAFPLPLIPCRGALGFFALPFDMQMTIASHLKLMVTPDMGPL